MSIRLMSYVFDMDLPATQKLVMLVLCDFANDQGERCHPSKDTVAEKASLSKRQVQRVMRDLQDMGLLKLIGNANGGAPGATCHYHINLAALQSRRATDDNLTPLLKTTGDSRAQTDDIDSATDDTLTPEGVTPMSSDPLTHSESNPDQENLCDELDVIYAAHCELHAEHFGQDISANTLSQSDCMIIQKWIRQGITPAFCREVFDRTLRRRKLKGEKGVNFRYWQPVIASAWAKAPASAAPAGKAAAPKPAVFQYRLSDPAARDYLTRQGITPSQFHGWLESAAENLRADAAWPQILARLATKHGKERVHSWLGKLKLAVRSSEIIVLLAPSGFIAERCRQQFGDDLTQCWAQFQASAKVVITE